MAATNNLRVARGTNFLRKLLFFLIVISTRTHTGPCQEVCERAWRRPEPEGGKVPHLWQTCQGGYRDDFLGWV